MKSARAIGGGGIDSVSVIEGEVPAPGPGEALVRMRAASLNFRDLIVVKGLIPGIAKMPSLVPLSCGVGQVVKLRGNNHRLSIGDRVVPVFNQGWISGPQVSYEMLGGSVDGVGRQYAVFAVEDLCRIPDPIGDLEAATLPCSALTAWSALTQFRVTRPGDWVLCHGTGGVSIAALQLAKAMSANVIITSSSEEKLARAKALGSDVGINYRTTTNWADEISKLIGGNNVANVIDTVGLTYLNDHASLLGANGQISAIGMLGSEFSWTSPDNQANIKAIGVGSRDQLEDLIDFIGHHRIRPVVDMVYDLERIRDGYRHLESAAFFGKIAINLL